MDNPFEIKSLVSADIKDLINKEKRMSKNITLAKKQAAYAEGRKAFDDGKPRENNPYIKKNDELKLIWWYGWDTAKKDSVPVDPPEDPEQTIPRPQ
jgi:hypothetical protein